MTGSFERRVLEVAFLGALVAGTVALHFAYSFHSPFPQLTGAPLRHDPVYNYCLVLAASLTGYAGARAGWALLCALIPEPIRSNRLAQRAALSAVVPACIFALYVAAGSPAPAQYTLVKWLARNWERNGRRDLEWCLRLLVLLVCWQALLGFVVLGCRTLWWALGRLLGAALARAGQEAPRKEKPSPAPCEKEANGGYRGNGSGEQQSEDASEASSVPG